VISKIIFESATYTPAFLPVCQRHRHRSAPDSNGTNHPRTAQTGTNRHRPALTGLDRQKTGTDRPGLFNDVFDTHFVLNTPKRYDILKILIKNVMGRSVPVWAGRYRRVLLPLTDRKKRCKFFIKK
jgi:hypothetical protein